MNVINREELTIILVDDNLKSMNLQINEIEQYLKQKKLKMNLLQDDSGEQVEALLELYPVDIVLTDKKMENDDDGLRVIKTVRNKGDLIDILLYSGNIVGIQDYRDASLYTKVMVVESRLSIVDPVKTLIDRHLSKWDDIIFLRGVVISKIIDLELGINEILSNYFNVHKTKLQDFHELVLENRTFSFEGKKESLIQILKKMGLWNDFKKIDEKIIFLQKKRNYLAHCKSDPENRNWLISMGNPKKFEPSDLTEIYEAIEFVSVYFDKIVDAIKNHELKETEKTSEIASK